MPNRIIREGILSSDRVDQLDAPAEVFYRRLMSKVDDHGLYDARLSMLRSSLYPLRVDRVREADISRWIAACEKAGLIALYQHAGKPYLQMLDTRWAARSEAKYPLPTEAGSAPLIGSENSCAQVHSDAPVVVVGVVVEDGGGSAPPRDPPTSRKPSKPRATKTPIPDDFAVSQRVREWAQEKGFDRIDEHLEAFARKCKAKAYAYADWDLAFMEAIREDWAKLRGRAMNGAAPAGEGATVPAKEVAATESYLERQKQHAARSTPPPASLQSLRKSLFRKVAA